MQPIARTEVRLRLTSEAASFLARLAKREFRTQSATMSLLLERMAEQQTAKRNAKLAADPNSVTVDDILDGLED